MSAARKSVIIAPVTPAAQAETMGFPEDDARFERGGGNDPAAGAPACPACGARARRARARYCSTCGRALGDEYFPTDALRASYRFEHAPARAVGAAAVRVRAGAPRWRGARGSGAGGRLMRQRSVGGIAATSRAFVVYALIPYLGILFCPGALLLGFAWLLRSRRAPATRRAAALSVALGLLILCAQLILWWILYKVPEWSRNAPF